MKKRNLWHSCLSAKDKKHLKEDAGCSLTSKDAFLRTRKFQTENNVVCFECAKIAKKLGLE